MFSVTVELVFSYAHRIQGHQSKCRHLHGHNARVLVTLSSPALNDLGMVVDFGDVKKRLGGWIDAELDHRTILHYTDPLRLVLEEAGEVVVPVGPEPPTAEVLARTIYEWAANLGFPVARVEFWETPTSMAAYTGEGKTDA